MSHKLLCEMKWRTDFSSLANQARFGLKYLSKDDKKAEALELLRDGSKLCSILVKAAEIGQKDKVLVKELDYCTAAKPLKNANEDLSEIEKHADKVLRILNKGLNSEDLSEENITYTNSFLVKISQIYQREAWEIHNRLCSSSY